MVTLKVADILAESVVDGLGIRTVVFFQGCPRHCPGCHNAPLISFEGGTEYYPEELAEENEIVSQDPDFSREYCVNLCDSVWGDLWNTE